MGSQWRGLRLLVHCDNAAVVSSLNSGRVQDSILAACLRELWFLAASHGLRYEHFIYQVLLIVLPISCLGGI